MRTHGPVPVQAGEVGVAAILFAPIRVDDEAWGRQLGKKGQLQGRSDQYFRHGFPHVPAHDVPGVPVLEDASIGPLAVRQR